MLIRNRPILRLAIPMGNPIRLIWQLPQQRGLMIALAPSVSIFWTSTFPAATHNLEGLVRHHDPLFIAMLPFTDPRDLILFWQTDDPSD